MSHPVHRAVGAPTDFAFIREVVGGELQVRLLTRHIQVARLRETDSGGAVERQGAG